MPFDYDQPSWVLDECVRMSVACILDQHQSRVRHIPPKDGSSQEQIAEWNEYLRNRFGIILVEQPIKKLKKSKEKWLAVIDGYEPDDEKNWTHMVVMDGKELYYDCNPTSSGTKTPKEIYIGYKPVSIT